MRGLVIKNTGSWYTVKTDDGRTIESKIKGNFRLKGIRSTNPISVGDYVQIIINQEGTAFISEIEDRKNYIIRKSSNLSKQSHIIAANLDQAFLIVTINYPETSTTFIDRFLAGAEAYRVPVVLVFNKHDLLNEDERRYQEAVIKLYESIGYKCVTVQATAENDSEESIEKLRPLLAGKVTLMSGNSGVGKSTIINKLLPNVNLRTAEISDTHNTGMHTTTFSEMLELPEGATLLIRQALKVLAHSILTKRNLRVIFVKYSSSLNRAALIIVRTRTSLVVLLEKHWKSITSPKVAIIAIFPCWKIRTKINIARPFKRFSRQEKLRSAV